MSIWFTGASKTDLDDLLELRSGGDPQRANVGFKDAGGADMAARYLPASEGDPGPNVFFYTGAAKTDVGPLFCKKGTRLNVDTRTVEASSSASGSGYASAAIAWNTTGVGGDGWAGGSGDSATADFQWLLSGSAGDHEIKLVQTDGSATPAGSALGSWITLSNDVTLSLSANNGEGLKSASGTYTIRRLGNASNEQQGSWSLSASSSEF